MGRMMWIQITNQGLNLFFVKQFQMLYVREMRPLVRHE